MTKVKAHIIPSHAAGPGLQATTGTRGFQISSRKMLLLVWLVMGVLPMTLQIRSYAKFVTPHKITARLVVPDEGISETSDVWKFCPVKEWYAAGVYWNMMPTHYFQREDGILCHYVIPQYNVHGNYFVGNQTTMPFHTSPEDCANESYPFEHYFYHGSIGFYSLYGEVKGTYCPKYDTAYVLVGGLGTFDINGPPLASDDGGHGYRRSYWYAFAVAVWIIVRCWILRRSYVVCSRFARSSDHIYKTMGLQDAMVFVHESMRLSAHGANNYHRLGLAYLLVEGLMSDLFLLTTQEGMLGRLQCISLGYNLAGIMSMLFEMIETMHWLGETNRCFLRRVLFNHETVLVGELLCAAAMQYYVSSLNRSSLKEWRPAAEEVSYYVMSLAGHGIIVVGCVLVIICSRVIGAVGFVRWKFGSLAPLSAPCCVDTVLGVRSKLILLGGYAWDNGNLYYKICTLRAFGLLKVVEEDGKEYLAIHKLHWFAIPKDYVVVIGSLLGSKVVPCDERPSVGTMSAFGRMIGGKASDTGNRQRIAAMMADKYSMQERGERKKLSATRIYVLVWMAVGLGPLFLQIKGYVQFVTPHKISQNLITPVAGDKKDADLHKACPVNELFMAGAYWNVAPTHYYYVTDGVLCHFVMPQYNLHGNYFLGNTTVEPYTTTPASCSNHSFAFANYFYHGSIGYYSFYAEGEGTFCFLDNTAYDIVKGVGTLDINGAPLANDKGQIGYLKS
ncbi:hypothetical protein L917_06209 [Phytophthora nicotianae]|nr:hypothetical protein L917_06209 [Phytophthora nicotianae]